MGVGVGVGVGVGAGAGADAPVAVGAGLPPPPQPPSTRRASAIAEARCCARAPVGGGASPVGLTIDVPPKGVLRHARWHGSLTNI